MHVEINDAQIGWQRGLAFAASKNPQKANFIPPF
jgi:hypothetical protein